MMMATLKEKRRVRIRQTLQSSRQHLASTTTLWDGLIDDLINWREEALSELLHLMELQICHLYQTYGWDSYQMAFVNPVLVNAKMTPEFEVGWITSMRILRIYWSIEPEVRSIAADAVAGIGDLGKYKSRLESLIRRAWVSSDGEMAYQSLMRRGEPDKAVQAAAIYAEIARVSLHPKEASTINRMGGISIVEDNLLGDVAEVLSQKEAPEDIEPGTFESLFVKSLRNSLKGEHGLRFQHLHLEDHDHIVMDNEESKSHEDLMGQIMDSLHILTPTEKRVMVASYQNTELLSQEELAARQDMSHGSFRTHHSNAVAKIRKHLLKK